MQLSSRQHPLIKLCRSLHSAKGRRESGLFLLEGTNAVEAALKAEWPLQTVLAREEDILTAQAQQQGIEIRLATSDVLAAASEAQTAPAIIALGKLPSPASDFELDGLLVILDGIGDPGNVGTILRAADAAGAEKVILTAGSADVWNPKVVRSAAGSLFAIPPLNLPDRSPEQLVELLNHKQIPIITAEAHAGDNCFDYAWPKRAALVLGHETHGISPVFAANAHTEVNIPVWGRAESLNVAMAGTLLMYAWASSIRK